MTNYTKVEPGGSAPHFQIWGLEPPLPPCFAAYVKIQSTIALRAKLSCPDSCIMLGRKQLLFVLLLAAWSIFFLAVYSINPNSIVSNISLFFKNESHQGKEHFKVVSAISSSHFEEARDMIASAQRFLPTTRIVVYDLGLKENERKELESFCNVEVRKFVFKQYPPHYFYGFIQVCLEANSD